jgi:hypothetical protein
MFRTFCLVVALWFAGSMSATAQTPRPVTWDDLLPPGLEYPKDPLEALTDAQREDLGFVARVRDVKARARLAEDSELADDAREREKNLRRAGIDIDGLIARVRAADAELQRVDEAVNTTLDGQFVKMPGYVLPLEYAGSKVTEFLLVPFVGACIHVPPPPPNQIVHVKVEDGFEDSGIFTPVYVTGRMTASGGISKSVFLTDGKVNVSFGYGLQATAIEKYRE